MTVISRKYNADDPKAGFSLKELKQIVKHAEDTGMIDEKTHLRTGATGFKGKIRNLELIEEI